MKRYEMMTKEEIIEGFIKNFNVDCVDNRKELEIIYNWLTDDYEPETMTMEQYVHDRIPSLNIFSVCPCSINAEWGSDGYTIRDCDNHTCDKCWGRLVDINGKIIPKNS